MLLSSLHLGYHTGKVLNSGTLLCITRHFEVLPDSQRTAKNQGRVPKSSGIFLENFILVWGNLKQSHNLFIFLCCPLLFIFILHQSPSLNHYMLCFLSYFRHVRLCDPMDCSLPASSVHGILHQEYWSGFPCSAPGDLSYPGIEPTPLMSPALAGGFFTTSATWEACLNHYILFHFRQTSPQKVYSEENKRQKRKHFKVFCVPTNLFKS